MKRGTAAARIACAASCPIPITNYKEIVLAHGSGGKLSHQLIEKMVLPQFRNELLAPLHDGAIFSLGNERVAFSTDSYVVNPIFFPGGDIGKLAVHGTVNDLAMCGARPLYLSVGFILEEGTPMEDFWRVVQSMRDAAEDAGVKLVTGDTKVVDRGKADKIFINTSGVGVVPEGVNIHPRARAGGRQNHRQRTDRRAWHRDHVGARRAGIRNRDRERHRRPQRSGRNDSRSEQGHSRSARSDARRRDQRADRNRANSQVGMLLDEARIPISEEVKGACEILGLDPLYVANEGKLLAIVPPADADESSPRCDRIRSAARRRSSVKCRGSSRLRHDENSRRRNARGGHAVGRTAAPHLLTFFRGSATREKFLDNRANFGAR